MSKTHPNLRTLKPSGRKSTAHVSPAAFGEKCTRQRSFLPSIGREERIPCYDCLQPRPTYAGWRLKSAEAVIMLPVASGNFYCVYCLETRLRFVTHSATLRDFSFHFCSRLSKAKCSRRCGNGIGRLRGSMHILGTVGIDRRLDCELESGRCVAVVFVLW